jgi:hypothetical protein
VLVLSGSTRFYDGAGTGCPFSAHPGWVLGNARVSTPGGVSPSGTNTVANSLFDAFSNRIGQNANKNPT